jgi:hypothetical protein
MEPFINDALALQSKDTIHGRGIVATKNISEGDCLFITPPVLCVDQSIRELLLQRNDLKNLEELAIEILVDYMWESIQKRENAKVNSFLAMMGSSIFREEFPPDVNTLLGRNNDMMWNKTELQQLKKEDLKQIVLKNAFGPDCLTYDILMRYWKSSDSVRSNYIPHHLLGIFPFSAMINHSCMPNAVRVYVGKNMVVHASAPIAAGEEIVWPYVPPTLMFMDRRRSLKKVHGFICKCRRCSHEAKYLKSDILPITLKTALDHACKWNQSLIDVTSLDTSTVADICNMFKALEDTIFSSTVFSNETKRHLRVGLVKTFFNAYNVLLNSSNNPQAMDLILESACQLHFSFVMTIGKGSTEHLSLLHLCLELATSIDGMQSNGGGNKKTKFWTEQLKQAHLVRFGALGNDIKNVRKTMQHTKTVLRQKDGFFKSPFQFL